ncbi:MAG: hypothetical protein JKY61_00470 [Planctomycetes bacterium]|nr:hypothetical protein [Planctomycetota bacterium]
MEAESLGMRLVDLTKRTQQTKRGQLQRAMRLAAREAFEFNWDGNNSLPANSKSVDFAEWIIRTFPLNIPSPEVDIDPDGEVSFHWKGANMADSILAVFRDNKTLTYSALTSGSSTYGNVQYKDNRLPDELLMAIGKLLGA